MEETGPDTLLKMFISNLPFQVLMKNYFHFNDQLFEQKQGTAMGMRMAPNYAILFIYYLETSFLISYPKQQKIWLRFIDDIFMIWKDGEQQLKMFLEALNNYHPTIKFTQTTDKNEIAFLDTIEYRPPTNRIYTKIYYKPTDQKQYLCYYSAQPKKQKRTCPLWPSHQMAKKMHRRPLFKEEAKKYIIN